MSALPVPTWVVSVVLSVCVSVFALTWRGISEVARRLFAPEEAWRISTRVAAGLITWLLAGVFLTAVVRLPNTTSAGVVAPLVWVGLLVVIGYGARFVSSGYLAFVLAIPQSWLIGLQFYRVLGVIFLVLLAQRVLPAHFAYPAGVGDLLAGLPTLPVAYLCARHPARARAAAYAVNLLGIVDFAVALGIGTNLLQVPAQALFGVSAGTTAVLPIFPLGLIPTVIIPLGFVLHLHSLTNLWEAPPANAPLPGPVSR